MVSRLRRLRIFATFWGIFVSSASTALACLQPAAAVSTTSVPEAYAWLNAGVAELRSDQNFSCASRDFTVAASLFRRRLSLTSSPQDRRDSQIYLVTSLSYEAVAKSKLGDRRAASGLWSQAISEYRKIWNYSAVYITAPGDRLFAAHRFSEAFKEYQNEIFQAGYLLNQTTLSVDEMQSGVAVVIKKGLGQAVKGDYLAAASTLRRASLSPAAYYLEGQAATAGGDIHWAYKAFVDALLAQIRLPAQTGSARWIVGYAYPAWVRLVAISKN